MERRLRFEFIKRKISFFLMLILLLADLAGQAKGEDLIKFSPDFKFNEGFYINFEQVKTNSPVPTARVITELDHTDPNFYNEILDGKRLSYFDDFGIRHEADLRNLWGFSRNGAIFIQIGDVFNRVTFIGSICHFVATITSYNTRYYDPYYYNPYSPYRYMYSPSNYSSSEMRQFLIDFETGKVLDYNESNLEVLLMKDPELHDEYMGLRKKKKKQLKFMYIRKFNERNPLYLPTL